MAQQVPRTDNTHPFTAPPLTEAEIHTDAITVWLVEDDSLFRESVQTLLRRAEGIDCTYAFGRLYNLTVVRGTNSPAGDLYARVLLDGSEVLRTATRSNTDLAFFYETASLSLSLTSVVSLELWEDDVFFDDKLVSCAFNPVTADVLRSATTGTGFTCTAAAAEIHVLFGLP